MTTMNREQLDRIMTRVKGLLAKAEASEFPEERATLAAKAEALMFKYRIEETQLADSGQSALAPTSVLWDVYPVGSPHLDVLRDIAMAAIHHTGCRAIALSGYQGSLNSGFGESVKQWRVYGWESDLRYAEELFISARLAYLGRMDPQVDPAKSDDENAFRLRMAGVERGRIGEMIGWGDKAHIRVTNAVKRYAKSHDIPQEELDRVLGKGNSMKVFRKAFRHGFTDQFRIRLSRARMSVDTGGQALIPVSRQRAVDELFYSEWPQLRPTNVPAKVERCDECRRCPAHESQPQAWGLPKPNKWEAAMGYAPCNCRPCSIHRFAHITKAEIEEANRIRNSPGVAAGEDAARRVEIRREAPSRLEN